MGRRPKPWFHERDQCWVSTIGGKRHRLATREEGESKAWVELDRLKDKMARGGSRTHITAAALFDHFLDHVQRHQAPITYVTHRARLASFLKHVGMEIAATDLRPFHVTRWLAAHNWAGSTQHGGVTSVKVAMMWGKREGYIEINPVQDMRRPTAHRRNDIMTGEQATRVLAACREPAFRDLIVGLRETGARPSEIMRLTAAMVDRERGTATLRSKTSKKTGRQRIIYLNRAALDLIVRLEQSHPEGPLFRNSEGTPWTRNAMCQMFGRIRRRLGYGPEVTAESFRHMFATDALEAGIPVATVSQLMGHSSTDMVVKVYSHLDQREGHLRDALDKIRPGGPPPVNGSA